MAKTLILAKTAPTDADSGVLRFVHGEDAVVLDDTYPVYEFHFYNLHPSVDAAKVMFQSSLDTGSNYNISTTTAFLQTYHSEGDGNETFSINATYSAGNSTSDLYLSDGVGYDNDQSASGVMTLYDPSDTDFVKNFTCEIQQSSAGDTCNISRVAGYINTTSAVDAIRFKFNSGNIDLGTIKMFGVS